MSTQLQSPIQPPLPRSTDNRLVWGNLNGSSPSLAIAELAKNAETPTILITPDMQTSQRVLREIKFFNKDQKLPIFIFPDWETLPYDHFSPHEDLISERLLTLYQLSNLNKGIVITALPTLMHRLLPREYLHAYSFAMKCNDLINLDQFRKQLIQSGYRHVEQVMEHGEFTIRGSLIDLFPMGSQLPYRIELFDNEVETIRSFDPENQRSIEKIEEIRLLPAREFPLTEESITLFRNAWRAKFAGNPMDSNIYASISQGESAAGVEYYLPLFFENEQTNSFFDYLPSESQIVMTGNLKQVADSFWDECKERYEQLRYDITRPLCEPNEIFFPPEVMFSQLKSFHQIQIVSHPVPEKPGQINFGTKEFPTLLVNHKATQPLLNLTKFLSQVEARIVFAAESSGRREVLMDLLKKIDITPKHHHSWSDFTADKNSFSILTAPLDQGLYLENPNIILIAESQLFGEQVMQRRLRKRRELDPALMIRNLTELNIGAPVVHIDHGIGRYMGLKVITTGDIEAEYLTLEYAGSDKIYVPVSSLHLISRYTGGKSEHAPLSRLGSKQWEKAKEKTNKRIRDIAAELLDIYSQRMNTPGFAFPKPDEDFLAFRAAFPFEETPDQSKAINDVIQDMTSPRCMDRLVCGDVGFGKTEVAMQAAFLAANSGKQVALLAPTTLLAQQHLQNFSDRFSDWPIRISVISRLRTKKEQDQIIQKLKDGHIDIIIGTHKLLSESIKFKDLGLLIVDEEHRFGVSQKERIKAMRSHVDILTLTATPIPRTLNMALIGTRDLSIITTPPARRLAIKTFVHEHKSSIIREAILRESMRGGQVYFLHNKVETIDATAEKLTNIVPEAKIAIAHGQMRDRELENVMSDFYHQKFNVLICTTIIESGIDVPTANTIIINRADHFGLAQLHQLRGRVGRSHHQAYAYLLTPPKNVLSKDAKKRLLAISSLEELGAGFQLATHDLEIRGAGELLGEEQSGHIESIGFTLYMDLLEEAVETLKTGEEPDVTKPTKHGCEIDFHVSALIPETFVHDVHVRLTLYKRLANCKTFEEIQEIKSEIIDRFGLLPEVTQNLFNNTQLKLTASNLGIKKIDAGEQFAYLEFEEQPNINPATIINLIQQQSKTYQLQGKNRLRMRLASKEYEERVESINKLINKLNTNQNN